MFILADCGGMIIPTALTGIISMIIKFIYIGVPILLIIWGLLDFGKAVMSQKEDDIKKGQSTFFKRLIAAVIVFFVVVIVVFVINILSNANISAVDGVANCINQIIEGK